MHGVLRTLFSAVLLIGTVGSVSAVELVDPATETIVFRHADVLGSPVATTDDQGRVLWYENTTAFGDSLGRRAAGGRGFGDNAALNPDVQVGYTGHSNDTASGLTYMKARYYDPAIGRFYSNDPVGFNTGNLSMFNRYSYANNNPYIYNDPDGEFAVLAWFATPPGVAALTSAANYTLGALTGLAIGVGLYEASDNILNNESNDGSSDTDEEESTDKGNVSDIGGKKAPLHTTPGTSTLEGEHVNDQGRVEPWVAHYDEYGRQIARTDYNAGNASDDIPSTHHHTREYSSTYPDGRSTGDHIPGEYQPQ